MVLALGPRAGALLRPNRRGRAPASSGAGEARSARQVAVMPGLRARGPLSGRPATRKGWRRG
eukprot:11307982-Alexandrium_andersonii.AAC.1